MGRGAIILLDRQLQDTLLWVMLLTEAVLVPLLYNCPPGFSATARHPVMSRTRETPVDAKTTHVCGACTFGIKRTAVSLPLLSVLLVRVTLPTRGQYIHKRGELGSRVHGTQDSEPGPGLTLPHTDPHSGIRGI